MFYLLLSFLLASGDLAVKTMIEKSKPEQLPKNVAGGFIEIRKEKNQGFACNRCEEEPETVQRLSAIVLGIVAVILIPFFLSKKKCVVEKLGFSMLLGGAISNVAERNLRGYVVDYVHVNVDKFYKADNKLPKDVDTIYRDAIKRCPLRKITFNLADVCIVVGGVMAVSCEYIHGETKKLAKKRAKALAKKN